MVLTGLPDASGDRLLDPAGGLPVAREKQWEETRDVLPG
jgi:hypothetical protein